MDAALAMQAKPRPQLDSDPSHEAHLADDSDHSVTYFATPHDNVLSALYGRSQTEKGCVAENLSFPSRSDVDAAPDNVPPGVDRRLSTSPTGFMRSSPSPRFAARSPPSFVVSSPGLTAQRETLTDPYDGTTLGVLVPNTPCPTSTSGEGQLGNEELWTQLSRITDLQTEVARMHLEMEGLGNGAGKGKGKSGENRHRRRRRSEVGRQSQSDTGLEEYDAEGIEMDDEETEQNRAREEEFAKLADQFEGRKESINNIMSKVKRQEKIG